jgi:hypothetical protein
MIIRIVITVPVSIRCPWIVPVIAVIIAIVVPVAIVIPIVEIAPAVAVLHLHTQVTIIIIFIAATVLTVLPFFHADIFILRAGRRIIYIIGGLTGLIDGGATAESNY